MLLNQAVQVINKRPQFIKLDVRAALAEAITEGLDPATRSALMLDGLEVLPEHDYDTISAMGEAADALGYKILH